MYTRKKPEDLDCGIEVAMRVFGGKWKSCIIDAINKGKKRPSEIHRAIASATPRVLNIQLKELENYKVVRKTIYPGLPPRVEYNLTEMGKSILPLVTLIDEWGQRNSKEVKKINEMLTVVGKMAVKH
jgi:DNA-binding HxlR family transcriptional regulator